MFQNLTKYNIETDPREIIYYILDGTLILSKRKEGHLKHIKSVLKVLRKENIFAKISKCESLK